ncbi:MAG: ABC transporter ATP-binding protein/permease [Asticcacaulis sp.]|nr:ABC transporter ATP-binding protein/permease [Asticcacaulis sp.]
MASATAGVRRDVFAGICLEAMEIVLSTGSPWLLKVLVDTLAEGGVSGFRLAALVLLFVLTWAGASIMTMWRMVYSSRVIDALTQQLAVGAIQSRLPEAASARDGDSGRLLGLIERLPYSLQVVVDGLIWRTLPLLIQLVASLAVIAALIPFHYAAILAAVLAGFIAVTWLGAIRHERNAGSANAAAGAVSHLVGDVVRNARRVVLNGALPIEIAAITAQFGAKRQATERMMRSLVMTSAFQYGVVGLGLLLLLTLGGVDVLNHRMTIGDFVLLQAYAFRLALPLSGLGFTLSQAAVSVANTADVLDLAQSADEPATAPLPVKAPAGITLRNVSFTYGPGLPGIEGISVDIIPGSFIVIVGANGSGKSTLAQLMAGILEPGAGEVLINGQDMSTIRRADRHRHILYVPQFIGLFNRTLGENAQYPPSVQSQADLASLLTEWRFHEAGRQVDFSASVGEQGERLSGGQVQKLELARLVGVKVPAIILDESTSALDTGSEAAAISSLRAAHGCSSTLLIITHELNLAESADEVLFMSAGRLLGHGGHSELLSILPEYADLWSDQQFGAE